MRGRWRGDEGEVEGRYTQMQSWRSSGAARRAPPAPLPTLGRVRGLLGRGLGLGLGRGEMRARSPAVEPTAAGHLCLRLRRLCCRGDLLPWRAMGRSGADHRGSDEIERRSSGDGVEIERRSSGWFGRSVLLATGPA